MEQGQEKIPYGIFTATYDPTDNCLRLRASSRLPSDLYARVKAAGFKWAPKQDLFVAPMWTPDREDLLIELAGEIDDEDKSLAERADERAERFEDYSDKRADDAHRARESVAAIADNIPLGQPILVGHHSERHARKDAQRIENGMRKAVNLWRTSQYWKARAAGAIRHAKYKERPDVRARRIKTLEADLRREQRTKSAAEYAIKLWSRALEPGYITHKATGIALTPLEASCHIAGRTHTVGYQAYNDLRDGKITPEQVQTDTIERHRLIIANAERWIEHYENRITYEKAMLEDAGASHLLAPPPKKTQPPLLNYRAKSSSITTHNEYRRGETITYPQVDMTQAEYVAINRDYKGTRPSLDGSHRFRTAMRHHSLVSVFLTDAKSHPEPELGEAKPLPDRMSERLAAQIAHAPKGPEPQSSDDATFRALADTLKSGVKTVVAPQLFPTPAPIADQVVELAGIEAGDRVLEPSAGTGNLIEAIERSDAQRIVAVEQNQSLVSGLRRRWPALTFECRDFLDIEPVGSFDMCDKVVMNPPFENGADIKHVMHALKFLRPGGRLVSIVANGPRQQRELQPLATEWIDLPPGTFKDAGTMVNTAIVIIDKEQN